MVSGLISSFKAPKYLRVFLDKSSDWIVQSVPSGTIFHSILIIRGFLFGSQISPLWIIFCSSPAVLAAAPRLSSGVGSGNPEFPLFPSQSRSVLAGGHFGALSLLSNFFHPPPFSQRFSVLFLLPASILQFCLKIQSFSWELPATVLKPPWHYHILRKYFPYGYKSWHFQRNSHIILYGEIPRAP